MSDLIDRQALLDECLNHYEVGNIEQNCTMDWICKTVRNFPTASPWHRVEEPPLPNQDLWLHDEHGYYHVGYISTYRGYTEYIDMDGNALHGIDYWMPIEPPKEDA